MSDAERRDRIPIAIDGRQDNVPRVMVEKLYERAIERGDEHRANHLLEALTAPSRSDLFRLGSRADEKSEEAA